MRTKNSTLSTYPSRIPLGDTKSSRKYLFTDELQFSDIASERGKKEIKKSDYTVCHSSLNQG